MIAKVKPNWDFWGLIDANGDYVAQPVYHYIHQWSEGILRLEKTPANIRQDKFDGEYSFINAMGEMITDRTFGYARDLSHGLAAVNDGKKWGFINKQGELAIPFRFDHVGAFGAQGCIVYEDGRSGLIGPDGEWRLGNTFDEMSAFAYGLAIAKKEGRQFVIDSEGNEILALPQEWGWFRPVSEKLILFGTSSGYPGERFYGFMDLRGNITAKPEFYTTSDSGFYIDRFVEGKLAVTTKKGISGYIDEEGRFEEAVHTEVGETPKNFGPFDEVLDFSEGLAAARKGDLWGITDEKFNLVTGLKYKRRIHREIDDTGLYFGDYFPKFSGGLLNISDERDTTYEGYIGRDGEIAIDLKFRVAEPFYRG